MSQGEKQFTNVLDTFDHVVVLMLENRSFDNLLGYLYSQKSVPPGKQFEGLDGKNICNPIPLAWQFGDQAGIAVTEVPVARIKDVDLRKFNPPYPDPGEDYPHVNTQIFNPDNPLAYNVPPYNLPSQVPAPTMNGFVSDYIQNYVMSEYPGDPTPSPEAFYHTYKYIMESYDPADLSVLSGLAREFAVFDHWFCSVPSETICNRNFWHAGTSWGHVINPGPADDPYDQDNRPNTDAWLEDTSGETLFSQLAWSDIGWKIYSDNKVPLSAETNLPLPVTPLLHLLNFFPLFELDRPDLFNTMQAFKNDCANGQLPAYSFIEPNFFNPHNDMHPSTPGELVDGGPQKVSPVLLGEALVCEIYNAIFTSPHHWDNTLLVITFDEHGGCHDHVSPPGQYGDHAVAPAEIATPPDLSGYTKCRQVAFDFFRFFFRSKWLDRIRKLRSQGPHDSRVAGRGFWNFISGGAYTQWDGFDFKRLGVRVPMIMVSPYITKNTIINTPMSHTSFLRTMHEKWGLCSLSAREDASPFFHDSGLLQTTLQRPDMSCMPVLAAPLVPPDHTDYSKAVLTALAKAIMGLIKDLWCKAFPEDCPAMKMETHEDAAAFLRHAIPRAKLRLGRPDALTGQINDEDGVLLLQAIAEELKKKKLR
jgi:phospholipase C